MKLFQQLLVAGATVSFIAPIAAQASDVVNLEEINSYTRSEIKSSRTPIFSNRFVAFGDKFIPAETSDISDFLS